MLNKLVYKQYNKQIKTNRFDEAQWPMMRFNDGEAHHPR
jgi:hypothetical protein